MVGLFVDVREMLRTLPVSKLSPGRAAREIETRVTALPRTQAHIRRVHSESSFALRRPICVLAHRAGIGAWHRWRVSQLAWSDRRGAR